MILTVENTASGIRETDFENMFERVLTGEISPEAGRQGDMASVFLWPEPLPESMEVISAPPVRRENGSS